MSWEVKVLKKVRKTISCLPADIRDGLESLIDDLKDSGPVRGNWPNYSKLSENLHHCHITYRYVAVWEVKNKKLKIIEVKYVGSRENAPY